MTPDPELEVLGYFTADGGTEATDRLLAARTNGPRAIFAESRRDGLRRAARDPPRRPAGARGHRGDRLRRSPMAELMDLSTVRQPVAEQAA